MVARASLVVFMIAICGISTRARAAEPPPPGPWAPSVVGGLTLAESAFSDNWSGGDKGALNWILNANLGATRQWTTKFNWSNQLQLSYGQTSTQNTDATGKKSWTTPDKTTDLILFESVGRFTLGTWVDPYLSFRLDSQFVDESPFGTLHINPLKLTETAGLARVLNSGDCDSTGCKREWIARLGFGFRQSIARTFTDSTATATDRFTTNDGGVEFQSTAKYPLANERVIYEGKLLVFKPVFFSKSDALTDFDRIARAADPSREAVADFWKAPDVNFQNTFTSAITSWLNVNLYVQWVYDKFDAATNVVIDGVVANPTALDALEKTVDAGIRKGGQFKQTLGIGLTYKFL